MDALVKNHISASHSTYSGRAVDRLDGEAGSRGDVSSRCSSRNGGKLPSWARDFCMLVDVFGLMAKAWGCTSTRVWFARSSFQIVLSDRIKLHPNVVTHRLLATGIFVQDI